ncbi:MAG TPA: hypothetical protein PK644_02535, partial [bacterium]|nr:hypothetical protein [bacterium]
SGPVFFVLALAVLMLLVTFLFFLFNKKKAIVCLVISLVYLGVAGYYVYLVLFLPGPAQPVTAALPAPAPAAAVPDRPQLILKVNGQEIVAEPDDELTVGKSATIELIKVVAPNCQGPLKANFVGFEARPGVNDGQDIGAVITYDRIDRRRAVNRATNKYKIELKDNQKIIGRIYIEFTE